MTNQERDNLIKEVVMKSIGNNMEFQKQLAANAAVTQKQQPAISSIFGLVKEILSGSVTGWELASIVLMSLKLCGLCDISWVWVFTPFAIPYVVTVIIASIMLIINKCKKKDL